MRYCNECLGSSTPEYLQYNLYISGVILAIVGFCGLISNILVMIVYFSREQRIQSTSIFLGALGFSDFFLVFTAMFLYVLEAWRHHDHPFIAWAYVTGAPIVFPLSTVFQTSSVYFCVAAAIDCFITVVLPKSIRHMFCTPQNAKYSCFAIMVFCLIYNIPHFFEIENVKCIDSVGELSAQICPTAFRNNDLYYQIYYTYMYTTFLAVGPLALLVLINICIVITIINKGSPGDDFDTVSLILVVFLFILCNFAALAVNFIEVILNDESIMVYLVDMSNLLVVVNGTLNFSCYYIFGAGFRATLKKMLSGLCRRKPLVEKSPKHIWSPTELGSDNLLPVDC